VIDRHLSMAAASRDQMTAASTDLMSNVFRTTPNHVGLGHCDEPHSKESDKTHWKVVDLRSAACDLCMSAHGICV
jgi:hypothetical protein